MDIMRELKEAGITLQQIATEIGKSRSWVSKAISGYLGEEVKEEVEQKIRIFLKGIGKDKGNSFKESEFLSTGQKAMFSILEHIYLNSYRDDVIHLTILGAESGYGKTYVSRYFAQKHKGVEYFLLNRDDNTTSILDLLCSRYGLSTQGVKARKERMLVSYLRGRDDIRMIIFDEADLLIYKFSGLEKIDMFRFIAEQSGKAVVLLGLSNLVDTIKAINSKGMFAYIRTRSNAIVLDKVKPTVSELRYFAEKVLKIKPSEIDEDVLRVARQRGYFRAIEHYFSNLQIYKDKELAKGLSLLR